MGKSMYTFIKQDFSFFILCDGNKQRLREKQINIVNDILTPLGKCNLNWQNQMQNILEPVAILTKLTNLVSLLNVLHRSVKSDLTAIFFLPSCGHLINNHISPALLTKS